MLMTAMTLICIGSVGFYVRSLLALGKECKVQWILYLVQVEPGTGEYTVCEGSVRKRSLPRAA